MARREQEKKQKVTGWKRLAGMLELPASSLANVTHMELEGNTQVRIENAGVILEYDSSQIRIKTGKTATRFLGHDLTIQCLSSDCLVIHGFITEIQFVDRQIIRE